jgi:hypothetical protein
MNVPRELLERVWEVYMSVEAGETIPAQLWDKSHSEVYEVLWGKRSQRAQCGDCECPKCTFDQDGACHENPEHPVKCPDDSSWCPIERCPSFKPKEGE